MKDLNSLFSVFTAYAAATGLAEATISTRALGRGGRFAEVRAGGDIGIRTVGRALEWFSDHWPEGAVWPAGVHRPSPFPRVETVSPDALPCPGSDGFAGTPVPDAVASRRASGAGEALPMISGEAA